MKPWVRRLGVILLGVVGLGAASGCPDKTPAPVPQEAITPAPLPPPIQHVDAGVWDAGELTGSPVPKPAILPSGAISKQASESSLLREYAQVLQWDVSDESLDACRTEMARLELGEARFTLLQLAHGAALRGGHQQWVLVRVPKKKPGPIAYSPLLGQAPFTPDYWQQVSAIGMTLQPLEDKTRRVLWVRLREIFSESEAGGEHVREKDRQLAYAFLVDERGGFTALALHIPERVTLRVDDEVTAETSLEVSIPSRGRLIVRPGPTGVDAEQKEWLGEHALTSIRTSPAPPPSRPPPR